MKSRDRQHHLEENYFSHGAHARTPRAMRGREALNESITAATVAPAGNSSGEEEDARANRANRGGGAWRPGETAQSSSAEEHAGRYGYGLGGEAHENWGAFDGDPMPHDPGAGQDEPWQHYHDADYRRWRAEHVRKLDEDYARWRNERFSKFSEEFSQWRDRHAQSHMAPPGSRHQSRSESPVPEKDAAVLKGKLK